MAYFLSSVRGRESTIWQFAFISLIGLVIEPQWPDFNDAIELQRAIVQALKCF